jgi:hypothetical protein
LALQIATRVAHSPLSARPSDLGAPPAEWTLRLVAFGDPVPVAKMVMLGLQAFDLNAANPISYQSLDYDRLIAWLSLVLRLDPTGQYPLHAASRIYAEIPDEAKQRKMLNFVYEQFLEDPDKRWPWLAQAASISKHRLKDLRLARKFAAAIQNHAIGKDVPLWARQMEAFILEDMNELEEAKIMIGGFIASGLITDPGELRFFQERLEQLERRSGEAISHP